MRIWGLKKGVESALWRRGIESLPEQLLYTLGWADDTKVVNAASKRQKRTRVNIAEGKRDVRRRRGILGYSSNDEEVSLYFTLYFHHPPRSVAGCWQRQRENLGDRVERNRRASIAQTSLSSAALLLKSTPSCRPHLRAHLGIQSRLPQQDDLRTLERNRVRGAQKNRGSPSQGHTIKKLRHLPQRPSEVKTFGRLRKFEPSG